MGPRTGLDDVEKRKFFTLLGLEVRSFCPPARVQSLYLLSYRLLCRSGKTGLKIQFAVCL
jgi:hypothetical protein